MNYSIFAMIWIALFSFPANATGKNTLPAIEGFNVQDSRDLIGDDLAKLKGVDSVST